ncbi:unnamed protein product [Aspergillus oryzae var. brunneus]|uniref:Unnamed protein product n=2 Tax=Aspergillus oryzae TaxID=5062 RepID=A0AAN5C270_ASPOZ|nr:unnamed protein product [Aspergillus oryzae]GMG34908.1 unnamed protein product [Aspergillus oryzae]GMG52499.1 unnamed protein product [Aspergillus oryzae var. brunneus]
MVQRRIESVFAALDLLTLHKILAHPKYGNKPMQTALVDAQWPRSSYDTSRDLLFWNSQDPVTKSGSVERGLV